MTTNSGENISMHPDPQLRVLQLGAQVADEAILIASSALHAALNEAAANDPDSDRTSFRTPNDTDLSVSEGAYRYLRQQYPDWTEVQLPNGSPRLVGGGYDIGLAWSAVSNGAYRGASYQQLRERSWQTAVGVHVAGLPDVAAWKSDRNSEQDKEDLAFLRAELHNPSYRPLPPHMMPHEIAAVRSCLPEHLQRDPEAQDAIWLAASGLHIVSTLYGHRAIRHANQIIGDLELPEYNVAATYHNGFDLVEDLRRLQVHFDKVNTADSEAKRPLTFTDHDRLDGMIADAYSDAVYGNGRRSNNPNGYDELRSGDLARAHARNIHYAARQADRLHSVILDTTFDETTGQQQGRYSRDPLGRAVAGNDLQILSEPESVEATFDLALEDGQSARFSAGRTIGSVMAEHGVRIGCTLEGMEFIAQYSGARPSNAPDGPTVVHAFASRLDGNAKFHDHPVSGYVYPGGWTLENSVLRRQHAFKLRQLSRLLLIPSEAGGIDAVTAYRLAQEHTAAMRNRYA